MEEAYRSGKIRSMGVSVFDFALNDEEMEALAGLDQGRKRILRDSRGI
ncbi:hypothetical protein AAAU98_03500 [Enterocloster citroniae]